MPKRLWSILILVILVMGVGRVEAQATDGLIRITHLVIDAPNIDAFIDGERLLENLPFFTISQHLAFRPGTHTIALVPAGASLNDAIIGPLEVDMQSGYSYIVAAIGQIGDRSIEGIVIDETTTFEAADLDTDGEQSIILHGISDAPEIDVYFDDERMIRRLVYGEYEAVGFPQQAVDVTMIQSGNRRNDLIYEIEQTSGLPNNTSLLALVGDYSDGNFGVFIANYSPLNVIDYMQGYSNHREIRFNWILDALEQVGLDELLTGKGPYTAFFPDDFSLEALPEGVLDELLADDSELESVLKYHIVPERVTYEDLLARADADGITRLVTLHGTEIEIETEHLIINDRVGITSIDFFVRNGVIHQTDDLLTDTGIPAGNTAFNFDFLGAS